MREQRLENAIIYIKFPRKTRKKTTKIGLYLASQFESNGLINITGKTHPPAPLKGELRREYWSRAHYRIMIGEKWFKPKAQYTFYTLDEVLGMVKGVLQ